MSTILIDDSLQPRSPQFGLRLNLPVLVISLKHVSSPVSGRQGEFICQRVVFSSTLISCNHFSSSTMSYEELQAEKGLPCRPPRVRWRSLSYRRHRNYYMTCVAIIILCIFTPIRDLTRPFFATYFFHYPITTFNAAEIASLTTEFYEILSKMGQFPPETIKYPPHNPPINANFAKSLGMAPQVIDLLQRLPYVDGNDRAWLYDAEFADFRYNDQLEQSRDPFHVKPDGRSYYSERGPYMRPWQVALNAVGDNGAVFLLDTWTSEWKLILSSDPLALTRNRLNRSYFAHQPVVWLLKGSKVRAYI